jgi:hypothetical protein
MFRNWQAKAARDGKSICCMIVLGLMNDVKFCTEKTTAGQSADYPKSVGYLLDQLETVLGGMVPPPQHAGGVCRRRGVVS